MAIKAIITVDEKGNTPFLIATTVCCGARLWVSTEPKQCMCCGQPLELATPPAERVVVKTYGPGTRRLVAFGGTC